MKIILFFKIVWKQVLQPKDHFTKGQRIGVITLSWLLHITEEPEGGTTCKKTMSLQISLLISNLSLSAFSSVFKNLPDGQTSGHSDGTVPLLVCAFHPQISKWSKILLIEASELCSEQYNWKQHQITE
jgi:hypothetical protein